MFKSIAVVGNKIQREMETTCASTPHWITAYSIQTCIYLSKCINYFLKLMLSCITKIGKQR